MLERQSGCSAAQFLRSPLAIRSATLIFSHLCSFFCCHSAVLMHLFSLTHLNPLTKPTSLPLTHLHSLTSTHSLPHIHFHSLDSLYSLHSTHFTLLTPVSLLQSPHSSLLTSAYSLPFTHLYFHNYIDAARRHSMLIGVDKLLLWSINGFLLHSRSQPLLKNRFNRINTKSPALKALHLSCCIVIDLERRM